MSTAPSAPTPGATAARRVPIPSDWSRRHLRQAIQGQGLLLMLLAVTVYFATQSEFFFTWDNFFAIGAGAAALGIMAVAQTYLVVSGGLDVSVGAVVALSGVVIGFLAQHGVPVGVAVAAAIAAGAGVGALNGLIAVQLKVNPIITTLGTMSIFTGIAFSILPDGQTVPIDNAAFEFLGTGDIGPVPFPFALFLLIVGVALVIERWTAVGRSIYAIGSNAEAARLAGLRCKLIPFWLFLISGLSAGLAGAIITSQLTASSPEIGNQYLLSVPTAVILGGASLGGGRGSVIGTLIAVFILGTLQNGFSLLGLPSYVQTIATGVVLIVAVLLQEATKLAEREET